MKANLDLVEEMFTAVNQHDINAMRSSLSPEIVLIDAHGTTFAGIESALTEWQNYFLLFPSYRMDIRQTMGEAATVVVFGEASNLVSDCSWTIPFCVKVDIAAGKISQWQIFADTHKPLQHVPPRVVPDKKVTGIGGVFFKCADPEALRKWYEQHLGFMLDQYGTSFEWVQAEQPGLKGFTAWSPMSDTTTYFAPSEKPFMINYRVQNLEKLIAELQASGVTICDAIETYEYGKFVHILDNENNKIELWEPVDEVYDAMLEVRMS